MARLTPAPDVGFSDILSRLPACIELDRLALEHKALERVRQVSDGASLLRLALARSPGGLSLRQTAAWASMTGLARLSNPAVKKRLDKAAGFLAAVTSALLAARAGGGSLLWPGRSLRAADGTSISKPGSLGTDWRVHGVFDLGGGGFAHLELTDSKGAESILRGAAVAGEVRIADRYYCRAATLLQFCQDNAGRSDDERADFIVRVRWNALRLRRPDGTGFDLIAHLKALPQNVATHECDVQAAVDGTDGVRLRLAILRKPTAATAATIAKLQAEARRRGKQPDPRTLVAAQFLILATSLPASGYPVEQVLTAYRLRWQIELAFKRLKSLLHIDALPTHTAQASRSWLHAHLILALLTDDLSQEFLESFPSGPARPRLSTIPLAGPEECPTHPPPPHLGNPANQSTHQSRTTDMQATGQRAKKKNPTNPLYTANI